MELADALNLAWKFAAIKHEGQSYAGPNEGERFPYLVHLGQVFQELSCAFATAPVPFEVSSLAYPCALLHDTIEDTSASFGEVESIFGKPIAEGVQALSKNSQLPSKKEQMLDSLRRIKQQPDAIAMVKMADRITNLSPPPFHWSPQKIEAYREEALLIYEALQHAHPALAKRLMERIESYGHDTAQ